MDIIREFSRTGSSFVFRRRRESTTCLVNGKSGRLSSRNENSFSIKCYHRRLTKSVMDVSVYTILDSLRGFAPSGVELDAIRTRPVTERSTLDRHSVIEWEQEQRCSRSPSLRAAKLPHGPATMDTTGKSPTRSRFRCRGP